MYGVLIASGILVSLLVGEKLAKDQKLDTNLYWSASLWVIMGGVVGARVYHVLDFWEVYTANPIEVLFLHKGGLGIYGAIIGGAISLAAHLRSRKKDILDYLDVSAVVIPLGQAVGRWGNFANMEILGTPTDLPWGMYVPFFNRPQHLKYNDIFHPLFLYESLLDILLFSVLLLLYRRKTMLEKTQSSKKPIYALRGFFTLLYVAAYGLIHFSLEFIRLESWFLYGVNVAQAISLVFVLGGLLGIYKLSKRNLP